MNTNIPTLKIYLQCCKLSLVGNKARPGTGLRSPFTAPMFSHSAGVMPSYSALSNTSSGKYTANGAGLSGSELSCTCCMPSGCFFGMRSQVLILSTASRASRSCWPYSLLRLWSTTNWEISWHYKYLIFVYMYMYLITVKLVISIYGT